MNSFAQICCMKSRCEIHNNKDSQVATKFFTDTVLILGLNNNLKTREIF